MNKRQERNSVFPLLYIQQPHLKSPKANMQKQFRFKETPEPIHIYVETEDINGSHQLDDSVGDFIKVVGSEKTTVTKNVEKGNELVEIDRCIDKNTLGVCLEKTDEIDEQKISQHCIEIQQKIEKKQGIHIEENKHNYVVNVSETKLEDPQTDNGNEKKTNKEQSYKKRVPFNDLQFEEKYKYLQGIPMTKVKVRFEFIMDDGKYQGYFQAIKDGSLLIIPVKGKETVKLPYHSLIDIKMIGI